MRKHLLVLLTAIGMALSLTACGSGGASSDGAGAVYYLNFKPEQDRQWQDLARVYTGRTGVKVTVITAASNTYEQTLMSEIAKTNAPTLFQVNGPTGLANWGGYCYDLTGSKLAAELTGDAYALKRDGRTLGVAYAVESYGLITNKTLLRQAGYTVEDIRSFADLKRVAEDVTARSDALGFSAFTSAGMDSSSSWRFTTHLADLPIYFEYRDGGVDTARTLRGAYLDNYKAIFDLYLHNAACGPAELSGKTGDDAQSEFLSGRAVFYQNGSWEYGNLVGEGKFTDDELAMLPIYMGVEGEAGQGLCTGTENYWCVNKNASVADIRATLDFLYWCVTSDEGVRAMGEDMGFAIPFKQGIAPSNLFLRQDAALTAAGKTPVPWVFQTIPSEEWKNALGSALTAYAAGTGGWDGVETAFVDNWAREYALLDGA